MYKLLVLCFSLGSFVAGQSQANLRFWCSRCFPSENICERVPCVTMDAPVGFAVCALSCGNTLNTVWPKPSGPVEFRGTVAISRKIRFLIPQKSKTKHLWRECRARFENQLKSKVLQQTVASDFGRRLTIGVLIPPEAEDAPLDLTYDTDESYKISINSTATKTIAVIEASNYFGARHGFETLSQLIVFDEIYHTFVTLADATIQDRPAFKHRGLKLVTDLFYFSKRSIERTIDAMAMVKLNRLHWKIFGEYSFPLVIKSQPEIHSMGAHSPWKIYTHEDVTGLVEYARIRGVRIYPEIYDIIGSKYVRWRHTACMACSRGACLPMCKRNLSNPYNNETLTIANNVLREIFQIFSSDVIYLVSQDDIDKSQFILEALDLWKSFQSTSSNARSTNVIFQHSILIMTLKKQFKNITHIINVANILGHIKWSLENGFKTIISVPTEYTKDWEVTYNQRFDDVTYADQILGSETTEFYCDESALDSKLWPKTSAFAERVWTNPLETAQYAQLRFILHRHRLIINGIAASDLDTGLQWYWLSQSYDNL